MYLPSAAGDRVLSILDSAEGRRRQLLAAARQRGISLNQLLAAAIVGSIQELVDEAVEAIGDNGE